MKKKVKQTQNFRREEEEREFWNTHDTETKLTRRDLFMLVNNVSKIPTQSAITARIILFSENDDFGSESKETEIQKTSYI